MMTAEKLRGLESTELEKQAKDMEESLFRIRFQMSMGQSEGLKKYREMRKDRARILGILRERQTN